MGDKQVGRSVNRLESVAKVTGTAEYIHNLTIPGMLHAKIVRSVHPHARITGMGVEAALAVPGVEHVLTAADIATVTVRSTYGPAFADQPVLAADKVRHVGEPVAVVLADSPFAAEAGAELIDVDYEELPAVFDEVEAAADDAPLVHRTVAASEVFTDLRNLSDRQRTNVNVDYRLRRGDVERGFALADRVYEHTFNTAANVHAAMEPFVCVSELGDNDLIIVHSATQNPSFVRTELARVFGRPENKIRVRTAFLGGGFGAKLYAKLEPLTVACALIARRPVKIALTMDEQFFMVTRHATTVTLKTGVTTDGKIVARQCDLWWNTGAYAEIGPRVAQKTGFTAAGPYDIEHVAINSRCVYTNLPPAGAMRGFGVPQVSWAYESQSDLIARDLGIDPIAFRRQNLLRNGDTHAAGTTVQGAATEQVLDELATTMRWDEPFDRGSDSTVRRGRGVAIGMKAVITPSTSVAVVSLAGDASCTLQCGTVDMGQGSDTAYAQLVAEVLGLEAEAITVVHPDTLTTPYDMGTLGSRSLFHNGHAIRSAAMDVRRQVLAVAATMLSVDPDDLELADGCAVTGAGERVALSDVLIKRFGMQAGNIVGTGTFTPDYIKPDPDTGQSANITAFWMIGGAGAEVAVDVETGEVEVTRLVVVGDVGRAVNPDIVRAQLSGAATMQLGMTLSEELYYENGQLTNTGLAYYKVPGILDIPSFETLVVEEPVADAPFGAKGVGESGTFAVSPAVANAVHDAVGARVARLPLTKARVWQALQAVNMREEAVSRV